MPATGSKEIICLLDKSEYQFKNVCTENRKEIDMSFCVKRAIDDDSDDDICNTLEEIYQHELKRIKFGTPSTKELLNKSFVIDAGKKKSVTFATSNVNSKSDMENQLSHHSTEEYTEAALDLSSHSTEEATEGETDDELFYSLESALSPMDYSPKLTPSKHLKDVKKIHSDEDKTPAKGDVSSSTISPETPHFKKYLSREQNSPHPTKLQRYSNSGKKSPVNLNEYEPKLMCSYNEVLPEDLMEKFESLTIGTPKHCNTKYRTDAVPLITPINKKTEDSHSSIKTLVPCPTKRITKYKKVEVREKDTPHASNTCEESPTVRLLKRTNIQTLQYTVSRKSDHQDKEEDVVTRKASAVTPSTVDYVDSSPKLRRKYKESNRSLRVRFVESLDCSSSEIAEELELVMRYRRVGNVDDLNNNTPSHQSSSAETPRSSKKKPRILFAGRSPSFISA